MMFHNDITKIQNKKPHDIPLLFHSEPTHTIDIPKQETHTIWRDELTPWQPFWKEPWQFHSEPPWSHNNVIWKDE